MGGSLCIPESVFHVSDSSIIEDVVRYFADTSARNPLNGATGFPILLERDAQLSRYGTGRGANKPRFSWMVSAEGTNRFALLGF